MQKTSSILILAIVAFAACIEAMPQKYQTLPYYPKPTPQPRPIRVRRQVLGGSVSSDPAGGSNARLSITKGIGTPDHNVIGQAFATGNTARGPVTTGGTLAYNNHGHGIDLTRTHTPGVQDSFQQSAHANLFNNGKHNLDAKVFASQNKLANGFKFERNGAGLDYSHINGHGASLTHSNIPGIGQQLGLDTRANLWSSQDRNTRLDLTGNASRWTSGAFSGKNNFGAGLGLTHSFG
ncbi:attacin-A [Drosophila grimshawi]|uniref:GH20752 n=1 Tax=Drosophila grimshawi TaxID=7222 RepID=B4J6L3_DROGR|nr:attacin-A [Drosophila grimshawi]EDW00916.1 GH20752 [Drosophila grimshawi]